ncbi:MAG: AAA family ATPase [Proteobacteria bacterium]|nr:AAA family ATPase [Pseudomonadota bacterium]MBU1739885.1 AAA family ATPase [Pseudomonadota bacterium]MBU1858215.1 AAA family ATPase [Verrucomicrobiota bacterium]
MVVPKFLTAVEICSTQFAPIKWIVPALIPEGLTILCGKPKTGKSWAVLDLAVQVASGGKVLGKIPVELAAANEKGTTHTPFYQ